MGMTFNDILAGLISVGWNEGHKRNLFSLRRVFIYFYTPIYSYIALFGPYIEYYVPFVPYRKKGRIEAKKGWNKGWNEVEQGERTFTR